MRAGTKRHTFELQEKTTTQQPNGSWEETWQTVLTMPGRMRSLRGSEQLVGEQLQATVTHEIRVEYDPSVTPGKRFKLGSRIFRIETVRNREERNRELWVEVEETQEP